VRDSWRRLAYRLLGRQPYPGPLNAIRRRLLRDWSIGLYKGPSPFCLTLCSDSPNCAITAAAITDVPAAFVADPFLVRGDELYMFFEIMNAETGRGEVGFASSHDGLAWSYGGAVLREPFHLSYPQVFRAASDYWLVPESRAVREIRLYRSHRFPRQWKLEATLVSGEFVDPTVMYHDRLWWLFASSPDHCLNLFYSDCLTMGWRAHRQNPVIAFNPRAARMAGRIIEAEGRLVRLSQDVARAQVRAFDIAELHPERYSETEAAQSPILQSRRASWNYGGLHHMDVLEICPGSWIATVDGRP
jgi:hypothetical protein